MVKKKSKLQNTAYVIMLCLQSSKINKIKLKTVLEYVQIQHFLQNTNRNETYKLGGQQLWYRTGVKHRVVCVLMTFVSRVVGSQAFIVLCYMLYILLHV